MKKRYISKMKISILLAIVTIILVFGSTAYAELWRGYKSVGGVFVKYNGGEYGRPSSISSASKNKYGYETGGSGKWCINKGRGFAPDGRGKTDYGHNVDIDYKHSELSGYIVDWDAFMWVLDNYSKLPLPGGRAGEATWANVIWMANGGGGGYPNGIEIGERNPPWKSVPKYEPISAGDLAMAQAYYSFMEKGAAWAREVGYASNMTESVRRTIPGNIAIQVNPEPQGPDILEDPNANKGGLAIFNGQEVYSGLWLYDEPPIRIRTNGNPGATLGGYRIYNYDVDTKTVSGPDLTLQGVLLMNAEDYEPGVTTLYPRSGTNCLQLNDNTFKEFWVYVPDTVDVGDVRIYFDFPYYRAHATIMLPTSYSRSEQGMMDTPGLSGEDITYMLDVQLYPIKYNLEIIKKDVTHDFVLENLSATFNVFTNKKKININGTTGNEYDIKGAVTGTYENGKIIFRDLRTRKGELIIEIKETAQPDGYVLDPTVRVAYIDWAKDADKIWRPTINWTKTHSDLQGKIIVTEDVDHKYTFSIDITNAKKYELAIVKQNAVTGQTILTPTTFSISGPGINGNRTTSGGIIEIDNLDGLQGDLTYVITETARPAGFVLDPTPKNLVVTRDRLTGELKLNRTLTHPDFKDRVVITHDENGKFKMTLTYIDMPVFTIDISKVDAETNAIISDSISTFRLRNTTSGQVYTGNTVDGRYVVGDLQEGIYTVEELVAPTGYFLDSTLRTIELYRDPEDGYKLKIRGGPAGFQIPPNINVEGTTVYLRFPDSRKYSLDVQKTDEDGLIVRGATFEIKRADNRDFRDDFEIEGATLLAAPQTTNKVKTFIVTADKATLYNLEKGNYILTETVAPPRYVRNVLPVSVDVSNNKVTVRTGPYFRLSETIINHSIELVVEKVLVNAQGERLPQSNVTFTLVGPVKDVAYEEFEVNGKMEKHVISYNPLPETRTTSGTTGANGETSFKPLLPGKYVLIENPNSAINIDTQAPRTSMLVDIIYDESSEDNVTFEKPIYRVGIEDIRKDAPVFLEVFKESDKGLPLNVKLQIQKVTVDGSGKITSYEDTYYRKDGANVPGTANRVEYATAGGKNVINLTVDETGRYMTPYGLEQGWYVWRELEAPEGYKTIKEESLFEVKIATNDEKSKTIMIEGDPAVGSVSETQQDTTYIVVAYQSLDPIVNEPLDTELKILKVDIDTKEPLEGAEFEVYKEVNGILVPVVLKAGEIELVSGVEVSEGRYRTGKDGLVVITGIEASKPGVKYVIKEVLAPKGYYEDLDKLEDGASTVFDYNREYIVNGEKIIHEVKFENKKVKFDLSLKKFITEIEDCLTGERTGPETGSREILPQTKTEDDEEAGKYPGVKVGEIIWTKKDDTSTGSTHSTNYLTDYGTSWNGHEDGITQVKYNKKTDPVWVAHGDIVIYTIRIFNEGEVNGWATQIVDDVPKGLIFDPAHKTNIDFKWILGEDGRVYTDYLSDKLIPAYNPGGNNELGEISWLDVKIAFKVDQIEKDKIVMNTAEIEKQEPEHGNLDDEDSVPGNKVPGEDDIDYDWIRVKIFDLALRKFITEVEDARDNTKLVDIGDSREILPEKYEDGQIIRDQDNIKYNKRNDAVLVSKNDIVIYTIRIFNEGMVDGYATEIVDDVPNGLIFLPEHKTNVDFKWRVGEDGRIYTDYLKGTLIPAYDPDGNNGKGEVCWADVKVAFRVGQIEKDRIVINTAEIEKQKSKKGDRQDEDSTPGNNVWGEDDIDIERIRVRTFELDITKYIEKVIIEDRGEVKVTDTGLTGKEVPPPLVKVDVGEFAISRLDITIIYNIAVTNIGELPGYAKEIVDNVPPQLKFLEDDARNIENDWVIQDGRVTSTKLADTLLQPGETAVTQITLKWDNVKENIGHIQNTAEITRSFNDWEEELLNRRLGRADLYVTVILGNTPVNYIAVFAVLAVLAVAVMITRRRLARIKNN